MQRNHTDLGAPTQDQRHIIFRGFKKYDVIEGVILAHGVARDEAHVIAAAGARPRHIVFRGFDKFDVIEGVMLAQSITKDQAEALAPPPPPPRPASLSAAASPAWDIARRRRLAKLMPQGKDEARAAIAEAMATNPVIVRLPTRLRKMPGPPSAALAEYRRKIAERRRSGLRNPGCGSVVADEIERVLDHRDIADLPNDEVGRLVLDQALASMIRRDAKPTRMMNRLLDRRASWATTKDRDEIFWRAFNKQTCYTKFDRGDAIGITPTEIEELKLVTIALQEPEIEQQRKLARAARDQRYRAKLKAMPRCASCGELLPEDRHSNARFCDRACKQKDYRRRNKA
jgi:hypothetical protein